MNAAEEQEAQERARLVDECRALDDGLRGTFWPLIDRRLADREQQAFAAITTGTDPLAIMRAVGELKALRELRAMPKNLLDSLKSLLTK